MREVAALAAAALLAAAPVSAADVTLVGAGGPAALSETTRVEVAEIVRRLAAGCSINSFTSPDIFRGRVGAAEWRALESRPHLYARYPAPFAVRVGAGGGRPLLASEVLIGVDDAEFIGPDLTRHDGVVAMHVKCDGKTSLELMCLPALASHLPTSYARNCDVLRRWQQRQD